MAKPFPREFREDVVTVARGRGPGVTLEQIATDFGVHPMTLSKWLRAADVEDGRKPGPSSDQLAELRELKRRNRLLEQEKRIGPQRGPALPGPGALMHLRDQASTARPP